MTKDGEEKEEEKEEGVRGRLGCGNADCNVPRTPVQLFVTLRKAGE